MKTTTTPSRESPFIRCPRYRYMENGVVNDPITFSKIEGHLTLVRMTFLSDVTFDLITGSVTVKHCVFKGRVSGYLVSESFSLYAQSAVFCSHTPGIVIRLTGSAVKDLFAQQVD